MTPLRKRGLSLLLAVAALSTSAFAQTYTFSAFETSGISDPDLLIPINLNATLSTNGTSVDVTISNDSTPGDGWITSEIPTITKIAFDDDAGLLPKPTYSNNPPTVVFNADDTVNIPGSNNIGFATTYGFTADPPPTYTGIDPGEHFVVSFENTDIKDLRKAISSGDIRIAIHVQQIGENDSASFVSVVPEPSSAMLIGLASLTCLLRRKR